MADKSSVLTFLRSQSGVWSSPAEIRQVVAVPERTLRNWLRYLVEEGLVEARGERRGRQYRILERSAEAGALAAPEARASTLISQAVFSADSQTFITRVEAPLYTRAPATYREDWLQAYVPNKSAYLTPSRREELDTLGKRAPIYGRAGTYIQKIYYRLLIDFTYNSSRLEGNTYTLIDTEHLLLQGTAAPGKPNAERIMILNHKEAIDYLSRRVETLQADEATIRTLHYLLADSLVAPDAAGQIREDSVRVSGTTYAPLDGRDRLTRLLLLLLEKARAILDPFEQSFFLLVHISYLQAFVDVNKRTARLASIIPLIRGDYVPQSFVDVDPESYLKATIAIYEFNEVGPLADLYAWSYRRSCQRYDTTIEVVGFDEISALYRQSRRALVADLVRAKIADSEASDWIAAHVPGNVEPQHREKFLSDVLAEINNLDASRIGGLGITRQELEAWQEHSLQSSLR
jgi:DNA-binding transcriptional ArsR family regulator